MTKTLQGLNDTWRAQGTYRKSWRGVATTGASGLTAIGLVRVLNEFFGWEISLQAGMWMFVGRTTMLNLASRLVGDAWVFLNPLAVAYRDRLVRNITNRNGGSK